MLDLRAGLRRSRVLEASHLLASTLFLNCASLNGQVVEEVSLKHNESRMFRKARSKLIHWARAPMLTTGAHVLFSGRRMLSPDMQNEHRSTFGWTILNSKKVRSGSKTAP